MTQLITIGVGQCGVQMATAFTESYMEEAQSYINPEARHRFFFETGEQNYIARCVLIDTESKAVTEQIKAQERSRSSWKFDRQSIYAQGCGSGNNWASGFQQNGFTAKEEVMERLQHQAEKCDRFGGFLMFQSLAGGTGSGLGSKITECVRDAFGHHAHIVNNVVWPYKAGEVLVQSYNSVLSLSCLLKNSDAVCVTYNDVLHNLCSTIKGEENVSFADMNMIIGKNLSSILLPSRDICQVPLWSQPLSHLVSIPSRRLLSLFSLPIIADNARGFTDYSWNNLVNNITAMVATGNFSGTNVHQVNRIVQRGSKLMRKCDSLWIVLRGNNLNDGRKEIENNVILNSPDFFPSDNDNPLLTSTSTVPFNKQSNTISAMANSSLIADPLDQLLGKCHNMIESGAFLHQYKEAGVDSNWINEDRLFLEQVLSEYQNM